MKTRSSIGACSAALAVALLAIAGVARAAPFMVVGLDEKVTWDEKGQRVVSPTGRDSVVVVDLARPEQPKILARLPLENSVSGPPVNVAVSPTGKLALVADAETVAEKDGKLVLVPTDKLFVIDLSAKPPRLAQTLNVGKQPSGLSFSPRGDLALVGYRADNGVGVLKVEGGRVREIGRIDLGDSISHVAFTPDGRRALAVKHDVNKLALLHVDGDRVTYDKIDLPTGPGAYNADVSPDGRVAATTDGRSLTLVDLGSDPAQVAGPLPLVPGVEGIAFSPKGGIAATAAIFGSNGDQRSPAFHRNGVVSILRVEGAKLTPIKQIEVGGVPEAIGFTPDGRYLLVGNFADQDFSILRVNGTEVTDTGRRFKVPGHPASARISPR